MFRVFLSRMRCVYVAADSGFALLPRKRSRWSIEAALLQRRLSPLVLAYRAQQARQRRASCSRAGDRHAHLNATFGVRRGRMRLTADVQGQLATGDLCRRPPETPLLETGDAGVGFSPHWPWRRRNVASAVCQQDPLEHRSVRLGFDRSMPALRRDRLGRRIGLLASQAALLYGEVCRIPRRHRRRARPRRGRGHQQAGTPESRVGLPPRRARSAAGASRRDQRSTARRRDGPRPRRVRNLGMHAGANRHAGLLQPRR